MGSMRPAQAFAAVGGIVYLAVGLIGFAVTGFGNLIEDSNDALLGFSLNPVHNLIHVAAGALLIVASRLSRPGAAEGTAIGVGLVLVLAAFLGFTGNLELLSISTPGDPDNYLHLVSGLVAIAMGFVSSPERGAQQRREAPLRLD